MSRSGAHRAQDRAAVLWDVALGEVLDGTAGPGHVLDVGGGTGGVAVRVAGLGHRVTVVDPSPDALASLDRRAAEAGVQERLHGVLGDVPDLAAAGIEPGSIDVALLHGVLEVVDDPAAAVAAAVGALRPGGRLSVVVAGRWAAVTARALAGDLERARALVDLDAARWDVRADGPRRFTREEATALVAAAGAEVDRVDAVRVFADLVPAETIDGVPGARAALLDLERAVAHVDALGVVAAQHHVLATRREDTVC